MDPRRPLVPPGQNIGGGYYSTQQVPRYLQRGSDTDERQYSDLYQTSAPHSVMPPLIGGRSHPAHDADDQQLYSTSAAYSTPPLTLPKQMRQRQPERQTSPLLQMSRTSSRGDIEDRAPYASPKADSMKEMNSLIQTFKSLKKDLLEKETKTGAGERGRKDTLFTQDDFMPPIDSMMSLRSTRLQRDRFFTEIVIGDVFCCSVLSVNDSGLDLVLLCYACKRSREIDQLKIMAHCSSRDIPEVLYGQSKEVSDVYSVKDKVTGVVIGLSSNSEKIQVSLLKRDLPRSLENVMELGLIRSEDLPPAYKTMCMSDDMNYRQMLLSDRIFQSPGNVERMCKRMNISTSIDKSTLMNCVTSVSIEEKEKAVALRKQQSRIHALHSVVEGVKLYKEGKQMEAMSCYNKALDIDPENVEALVARGAMYANNENYERALTDFRQALKVNPNHQNATDYMVQTMLAYARDLEDSEDTQRAVKCYRDILALVPDHQVAQQSLLALTGTENPTAEQEHIVSSTRPDTGSPAFSSMKSLVAAQADSKRGRDPTPPSSYRNRERRDSGYREKSIERRRKSIMSDNRTSRRLSSPDASRYNRERKARTPTSSSTSSTSTRSPSPTSAQPEKKRRSDQGKLRTPVKRRSSHRGSAERSTDKKERARSRSRDGKGRRRYTSADSASDSGSGIDKERSVKKARQETKEESTRRNRSASAQKSSKRKSFNEEFKSQKRSRRRSRSASQSSGLSSSRASSHYRDEEHQKRQMSRTPDRDDSRTRQAPRPTQYSRSPNASEIRRSTSGRRSKSRENSRSITDSKSDQTLQSKTDRSRSKSPRTVRTTGRPSRWSQPESHPSNRSRSNSESQSSRHSSPQRKSSSRQRSRSLSRRKSGSDRKTNKKSARSRSASRSSMEVKSRRRSRSGERQRSRRGRSSKGGGTKLRRSSSRERRSNSRQSRSPVKQRKSDAHTDYRNVDRSVSTKRGRSSDQSNAPTNTPGEGLDRYGMPSGDRTGPGDIFGELDRPVSQASSDHSTSADPATEMNKSAATAFLPYCLATDPVANRKTVIKPFSVKKTVSKDGTSLANFMIKAQKGQRKALIGDKEVRSQADEQKHSPEIVRTITGLQPNEKTQTSQSKYEETQTSQSKSPTREKSPKTPQSPRSRSKKRSRSRSRSRSKKRSRSRSHSKSRSRSRSRGRHRSGRRRSDRRRRNKRRSPVRIRQRSRQPSESSTASSQQGNATTSSSVSSMKFPEICNTLRYTGFCDYGESCRFSHSELELTQIVHQMTGLKGSPLSNAVRGKLPVLCRNYEMNGKCMFKKNCKYAHGKEEFKRLLDLANRELVQSEKRHEVRISDKKAKREARKDEARPRTPPSDRRTSQSADRTKETTPIQFPISEAKKTPTKSAPSNASKVPATTNIALRLATDQLQKAKQEELQRKKKPEITNEGSRQESKDRRRSSGHDTTSKVTVTKKETHKTPDRKGSTPTAGKKGNSGKTFAQQLSSDKKAADQTKIQFKQMKSKKAAENEKKAEVEKVKQDKKLKQMEDFLSMLKQKKAKDVPK